MFRKLLLTGIPALAIGAAALGLSSTTKAAVPALPIGQVEQVEDSDANEDGVTEADRGRGGRGWGGHRGGRGWGRHHGRHYHGRHYRHYGYGRYDSHYYGHGNGSGGSNCEQE